LTGVRFHPNILPPPREFFRECRGSLLANEQRKGALLEEGSFHSSIYFSSFSSVRRKILEPAAVKEIGTHAFPSALPAKAIFS